MPLIGPGRRMMRRRAVVGAAAVGGAAYYTGKKRSESSEREADQEARLDDLEAQGQEPAPAAAAPADASYVDELEQLARLHEEGILTDEEFEAKKKEILGL